MVQEGRGHAAIDVWAIGEAPLWSVSLFCGAGGDRAPSRSGLLHAGGCSSARAGGIDNLLESCRRNAATRQAAASSIVRRQRNGRRRARCSPPKAGEAFARNAALRTYVEERLAGVVVAPSRAPVPGPVVSWKKPSARTTEGPGDGQTPGARSRSPCRLPVDFPGRRDHAHQP